MSRNSRVFLIGPMGAGKTSVGKELSRMLGHKFYDADQILEKNHGMSISELYATYGERQFRTLEAACLSQFQSENNIVYATGGGCIMHPDNRSALSINCVVCYLTVSISEQCYRLSLVPIRPPLPTQQGLWPQYFVSSMELRGPLYAATADFVIATDGITIIKAAEQIKNALEELKCI